MKHKFHLYNYNERLIRGEYTVDEICGMFSTFKQYRARERTPELRDKLENAILKPDTVVVFDWPNADTPMYIIVEKDTNV
jgi:hypothetical protein